MSGFNEDVYGSREQVLGDLPPSARGLVLLSTCLGVLHFAVYYSLFKHAKVMPSWLETNGIEQNDFNKCIKTLLLNILPVYTSLSNLHVLCILTFLLINMNKKECVHNHKHICFKTKLIAPGVIINDAI